MSKSKHTPGPWTSVQSAIHRSRFYVTDAAGNTLAKMNGGKINAERIVQCVNACEGLADPSIVSELLALLKEIQGDFARGAYLSSLGERTEIPEIELLIKQAEGREDL